MNVPVGLAAIALTLARVPESSDPEARSIDALGVITFSTALFCLIFAIVRGNAEGWGSTLIVSLFVASAVLLVAFVVTELRVKEPMLDLSLFRKPAFAGASIVAFGLSCSMFSMFLYLTLYLQGVLGADPLDAGLYFLPLSVISFFVAPVAGRLGAQFPIRLFFGAGLTLVGVALLLMRAVDTDTEWTALIPGFVLAGIGVGMVNPSLAQTAVGVVPRARSGMGSGINNTFRQVGIATGTAMLGAIFQARVESRLPACRTRPGRPRRSGRSDPRHSARPRRRSCPRWTRS